MSKLIDPFENINPSYPNPEPTPEPVLLADIYAVVDLAGCDEKTVIDNVKKTQMIINTVADTYNIPKAFIIYYKDRSIIPERAYKIAIMEGEELKNTPLRSALNISFHCENYPKYIAITSPRQILGASIEQMLGPIGDGLTGLEQEPRRKKWWQWLDL
jgi:hypothetical protein